jgi:TolA-binding protein
LSTHAGRISLGGVSSTYVCLGLFVFSGIFPILGTLGGLPEGVVQAQDQAGQKKGAGKGATADSENEAALAQYADAANFQTNGELALAIENWQKFLKDFSSDPLAPKAAHYMGVCYMQLPEPNHRQAAAAFELALQDKKYELREESLSNLGWCLYVLGSTAEPRDEATLNKSLAVYQNLLKEFSNSKYADRALFYVGEAQYALGKPREAIAAYDRLLNSPLADKSALRCDALYAKGVAYEELNELEKGVAAYREMLSKCAGEPLALAVRLRLAEVLVLQKKYEEADELFAAVIAAGGDEKPRALYRRGFVLAQLNRADEAAKLYEQLMVEYPTSPFAANALLAAAQSYFRAGQMDEASKRFEQVLESQANLAAATEAAHWLSTIWLRRGDVEQAESVARNQIAKGLEGAYATLVKIDAAEALSMQAGKQAAALAEFKGLISGMGDDPLLSRLLYIAAFTAFQMGESQQALELTGQFFDRFAADPLASDVRYIAAEANLLAGNFEPAAADFELLLRGADASNPQLPFWVLRAASGFYSAGQYDRVVEVLRNNASLLQDPDQRAESAFFTGIAHLGAQRAAEAVTAFDQGLAVTPAWRRNDEMMFRLAAAHMSQGNAENAVGTWERIIATFPESRFANQSRYRLAQQASDAGQYDRAMEFYDAILGDSDEPGLRPFALYGRGWVKLQQKLYDEAIGSLSQLVDQYEQHPFRDDALLAMGISQRRLNQTDAARTTLTQFFAQQPTGVALGHGLYEMALLDRDANAHRDAVDKLQRLRREVTDYPAMDAVLAELAFAQKDAEDPGASKQTFQELVKSFPASVHAAEAYYHIGQQAYAEKNWQEAVSAYQQSAEKLSDPSLREKAIYRWGWSNYQLKDFSSAAGIFARQFETYPEGKLSVDALMMIGESHFSKADYQAALQAYETAKGVIVQRDGEGKKFTDPAEQQVRELVYLHGGQSAGQLERWDEALRWYNDLRSRYPASSYLAQAFYETGYVHQQMGNDAEAMKFYAETANTFRDEAAARARFMLGELYFKQSKPAEAITEFKRVMYGYGAEKAPAAIKGWQAKSGFEAGRCAELLIQANQGDKRQEAIGVAKRYYQYVIEQHPQDPLVAKSKERMDVLDRL